ncbi:FtsQ-type POTRA domain-containing protein [Paenibacillus sp. P25]|nr:FtsQ-type POTRA domain-containing protein [Paenibacillus sp. P25]
MSREDRLPVIKKPSLRSRSSKKLLLFLFIFFITLLLVLFFQSSLSEITRVEIEGQQLVSENEIRQAAAVKPGDHFFSVSSGTIENQVKALRMIESVEVSKHFPGVIHIQVKEYPKVAYQIGENGQVEAPLADASVVPVTVQGVALDMPILSGWAPNDPLKAKLCKAMAGVSPSYFADISEIKPAPSEAYPDKIKMYTRSLFEVQTTVTYLPDKIKHLSSYIASLQDGKVNGGVITMLEADSYAPFDTESKSQGKNGASGSTGSGTQTGSSPNGSASGKDTGKTQAPSGTGKDTKDTKDSKTSGKESQTN